MTYEEAKKNLKGYDGMIMYPSGERDEALQLAIESLETQIPKKPNITLHNGFCGECGIAWGYARLIEEQHCGYRYFQYCPTCGQRIKWESDEE